jgi:3-oxoacyl-[acyl-carrier-protein] synthase II
MSAQRRVVVTGLGATTPIGGDASSTWAALLAGKSGARTLTEDWANTIPVNFAARVAVEPSEVMERVELRKLDRSEAFALIASREAWKDAGSPEVDNERLGVVIASGIGGVTTLLEQYDILKEKGARSVSPYTVPMLMPNGPAAHVGLEFKARAGVHTPVSACASGAEAIGYAFEMIRNNRADVIISGGVEAAIHALPMAGFAAMKALSTRSDAPERASRPYDLDRDGFVLGEGGGVLILEEYEHAKARGAKIYAEICGYGMSADAGHMTAPSMDGPRRAMVSAMRNAGINVDQVGYLNAHGTSTPLGDLNETNAIKAALGDHAKKTLISSTKSMTGHLLGGAGGIESIFTVLALHHQKVPPTINLDNQDPECDLDYCANTARDVNIEYALKNNFGFGGTNGSLVFRRI